MILTTISSGSSGNCHLLTSDIGETLIIDCGVPVKAIKEALNWNIMGIQGAVCTHRHKDHSLSVEKLRSMGIDVFYPSFDLNIGVVNYGSFRVQSFDLTTLDGKWTHTNADGSECSCYGFLISHNEMGRMIYATDTELIKWKFKGINHILLGVNYDKDLIDNEDSAKVNHVYRGHMSIDTACDFVKSNNSKDLQNVIMCHLSKNNAEPEAFIKRMKDAVLQANVDVAKAGKEWLLQNPNECSF